ncbi:MAG: hypothetical protein QOE87_3625 [Gaiellales bacterium]|nr:hypothetical protein [Gaiellales bacterium]
MAMASDRGAHRPLVRCPNCLSMLIYPLDLAALDRDVVVSRRCPECEHRDVVVVGRLAAFLWFDRYDRVRMELAGLCDALDHGLPFDFDSIMATPDAGEARHVRPRRHGT